MKKSKVLLNVTSFFCFVYFALYLFTLVFIPIAIYCYIAGKNFSYKADHLDDTMKMSNLHFKRYVIFVSVFCFPFGLLSIIPYLYLTTNNVVITDLKYSNTENETQNIESQSEAVQYETESEIETQEEKPETQEEKLEKFRKLQNFKDKGFITEEELEQAREQIFGKKEDQ